MKNFEDRAKEIFEETQAKQARIAKKIILGVLSGMGFVFAILGTVFLAMDDLYKEIGIVFLPMGLAFIALGIILFLAIPTKYSYDKYKVRVQKYGYLNNFAMAAKIDELEARIDELEKKNDN